jgi:hypothetical protein
MAADGPLSDEDECCRYLLCYAIFEVWMAADGRMGIVGIRCTDTLYYYWYGWRQTGLVGGGLCCLCRVAASVY